MSLVGFKKPRLLSHPQTMGIFYLLFMPEGQIKNLLTLKYVCYIVTWLFNLLYLCMCTVLLLTQVSFKVTIICLGVFLKLVIGTGTDSLQDSVFFVPLVRFEERRLLSHLSFISALLQAKTWMLLLLPGSLILTRSPNVVKSPP